jgi:DNA polymerase-3 subunit gamma/tau
MASHSVSFDNALQELAVILHRAAWLQQVPEALAADDPDHAEVEAVCGLFAPEELQLHYQIVTQGRADLPLAPDEFAGFTMTLLRMLAFAPEERPLPRRAPQPASTGDTAPSVPAAANRTVESWGDLVSTLGLTGMARMLAQHCELVHQDEQRLELLLGAQHEGLLDKPFGDKLKAALRQRLGPQVKVTIKVGVGAGNSPAAVADRVKQQRQELATKEIEDDPFVRDLVENFDARVIKSTIRPIQ